MSSSPIAKLSEADQRELQTFLEGEAARSRVQGTIHDLTDMCWDKCKGSSSISSDFNRGEAACISNCVERFLDTSLHIVNQINQMGQQQGHSH
ncbi:Mitochondrial import inner membrane translocase subunit tim8 [Tilletia horrida]|uniref:Mitochondrial import inner membrane translocase subunit n=1 Tax=Tilletia horrida TaxID=155126 RepID=A0AAN6GW76_9BASI|nr:Mitochondrial import inner membrane translocase subunit tim8 [Tilletia horrida]KAK0556827.1 Mitochondrial import inner membrane translocase subunit tim8 [Tilletia horrida]KAK0569236.1 Mitochondrial import inner membrane translocase subunit tim8 [Tilletia horrida]